jgi:hypothetical protein
MYDAGAGEEVTLPITYKWALSGETTLLPPRGGYCRQKPDSYDVSGSLHSEESVSLPSNYRDR